MLFFDFTYRIIITANQMAKITLKMTQLVEISAQIDLEVKDVDKFLNKYPSMSYFISVNTDVAGLDCDFGDSMHSFDYELEDEDGDDCKIVKGKIVKK
jgi:hypothetical protein